MNTANQVVTANYTDRKSDLKWLIRGEDQHVDRAVPFASVMATEVEFKPSNEAEIGFGCTMVAVCKTAQGYNEPLQNFDPSKLTRLRFNWNSFENASTGEDVPKVAVLYLNADGHMWAQITGSEPAVAAVKEEAAMEA